MAVGINQITNPTPAWANWIFRIVLYVCSLGNIVVTTFTKLPDDVKLEIVEWSSFLVIAVHMASKMFGVPLPENTEIPARDVAALKTSKPNILDDESLKVLIDSSLTVEELSRLEKDLPDSLSSYYQAKLSELQSKN